MADLGVAGAAPLAVPDVFTELELVTMKLADEVGFPVITVVIMTVCAIRNVITLDILAILMVSHLNMRTRRGGMV